MKDKFEKYRLHGWDDEKIYFWDGEKERCVSDEKELYNQMLEICMKYFAGKKENTKDLNNGYRKIPCSKQIRKMITEDCG